MAMILNEQRLNFCEALKQGNTNGFFITMTYRRVQVLKLMVVEFLKKQSLEIERTWNDRIKLKNGAIVEFVAADLIERIRGRNARFIVMDEIGFQLGEMSYGLRPLTEFCMAAYPEARWLRVEDLFDVNGN